MLNLVEIQFLKLIKKIWFPSSKFREKKRNAKIKLICRNMFYNLFWQLSLTFSKQNHII